MIDDVLDREIARVLGSGYCCQIVVGTHQRTREQRRIAIVRRCVRNERGLIDRFTDDYGLATKGFDATTLLTLLRGWPDLRDDDDPRAVLEVLADHAEDQRILLGTWSGPAAKSSLT
jgi:hypothetical protein